MDIIRIALDWTPNSNHYGFFVADSNGYYQEEGLQVEIQHPGSDNYKMTPAKKVELGLTDLALCPTESLLSYQTKDQGFPLKAIATLFKEDLSAIAVLKSSGIISPKDLDGKSYASYQAKYEDGIVKQMIRNDGGKGNIRISYPPKLGIWETLINNHLDSTWIFLNWEGVQAENRGVELTTFRMSDFSIPYSYSPVIATDGSKLTANEDLLNRFLTATKKGFIYGKNNIGETVETLSKQIPAGDRDIDLHKSISLTAAAIGNEDDWGVMEEDNLERFVDWLYLIGLENRLNVSDLITNSLVVY